MYWWNASKLAEDLREGRVDERERFKYFLATFIAWNVVVQLFIHSGVSFNTDDLFFAALNLSVAISGIILCYRVNKSGDNTDFVTRMICLGWPVGIQVAVGFSALSLVHGLIHSLRAVALGPLPFLTTALQEAWKLWDSFLGILFVALYYLWICWYLAHVAQAEEYQNAFQKMAAAKVSGGEAALAVVGYLGTAFTAALSYSLASSFVGEGILAKLLTLLAVGLWLLLAGSIFVWLRRRSMKRAREDEVEAG